MVKYPNIGVTPMRFTPMFGYLTTTYLLCLVVTYSTHLTMGVWQSYFILSGVSLLLHDVPCLTVTGVRSVSLTLSQVH